MVWGRCHIPGCEDTPIGGRVGGGSRIEGCVHFEDGHAQEDILGPETTACDVVPAFAEGDGVWIYQDIFSEAERSATVFQPQLVRLPLAVLPAASLKLPAGI